MITTPAAVAAIATEGCVDLNCRYAQTSVLAALQVRTAAADSVMEGRVERKHPNASKMGLVAGAELIAALERALMEHAVTSLPLARR